MSCKAFDNPNKKHEWTLVPFRQKCQDCGILNPVGVPAWVRFWDHVDKDVPGGCWIFTGNTTHDGYGRFTLSYPDYKYDIYAHIYSYFLHRGKLPPPGYEFDHECRVRNCVNPEHLRFLTKAENVRRGVFKPICKRGHEQTPENRHVNPKTGRSRCRLCLNARRTERVVTSVADLSDGRGPTE